LVERTKYGVLRFNQKNSTLTLKTIYFNVLPNVRHCNSFSQQWTSEGMGQGQNPNKKFETKKLNIFRTKKKQLKGFQVFLVIPFPLLTLSF
jgi:hypothetical protein